MYRHKVKPAHLCVHTHTLTPKCQTKNKKKCLKGGNTLHSSLLLSALSIYPSTTKQSVQPNKVSSQTKCPVLLHYTCPLSIRIPQLPSPACTPPQVVR